MTTFDRKFTKLSFAFAAVFQIFLVLSTSCMTARADDYFWNNPFGGDWGNTNNWRSGDWVSEGGKLVNLPGALVTVQCDNTFGQWSACDSWLNWGTLRKTAGTDTNFLNGVALNNAGTVDLQRGGLSFQNGLVNSGTFNVAAGAAALLASGTFNLLPGSHFTGAGYYGVWGNVTITGEIPGDNFRVDGAFDGTNTVTGTMNSYNAYISGRRTKPGCRSAPLRAAAPDLSAKNVR